MKAKSSVERRKKYVIGVRDKFHPENFKMIKRVLKTENIGNFNPIFCNYKKEKHLVQSSLGDLSDPYRRTEDYIKDLYIEV
jgi:hypothetical protein